ncbi:MAG: response regulator transcription factor [Prevotellaceae bacterium]|jgi:DNA-binding response OmpR family regulator|nr:response regulator transcription factor [Prevotellaceae bacterium]
MERTKILLAEDEENMGMLLRDYLTVKGYSVNWFTDGEQAFKHFSPENCDICILDVMMPKKDGITLAQEIRQVAPLVPIMFLTSKSQHDDIMEGFLAGADDYLCKPFRIEELILRIEAILRRTKGFHEELSREHTFVIGEYTLDVAKQKLFRGEQTYILTSKESELLHLLCLNRNQVLDRNFALQAIWSDDTYFNARSMDVYIAKLRKRLKDDPSVNILTVHGRGFKLIS